jgi:hypothetical protein
MVWILKDKTHMAHSKRHIRSNVDASHGNRTALGWQKTVQKPQERAFPCAISANQPYPPLGAYNGD